MKLEFEISKVTIIKTHTTDKIILSTTLPGSLQYCLDVPLYLSIDASFDTGEKYCNEILGIESEIITIHERTSTTNAN